MTNSKFEKMLANYCSPVLMGEKVSNLFSTLKSEIPNVNKVIVDYNCMFNKYDLFIENICECENRVLIFVYKKTLLEKHFRDREVISLMDKYGYSIDGGIDCNIDILKQRIKVSSFPHEIGIFLGYPITDVIGFIDNQGQNYKYCGYWKVYKNVARTKRIFHSYDSMRKIVSEKLECGECIENILIQIKNNLQIA